MVNYPNNFDDDSSLPHVSGSDERANTINASVDTIENIEHELGINPKGPYYDVRQRLDILEARGRTDGYLSIGPTGPTGSQGVQGYTGATGPISAATTITYTIINPDTWEDAPTTVPIPLNSTERYDIYTLIRRPDGYSYTSYCRFAITNYSSITRFVGYPDYIDTLCDDAIIDVSTDYDNEKIRFNIDIYANILNFEYKSAIPGAQCTSVVYESNELSYAMGATGPTGPTEYTSVIPAGVTANGIIGQYTADANYYYVCYSTNRWIRVAKDGTWI